MSVPVNEAVCTTRGSAALRVPSWGGSRQASDLFSVQLAIWLQAADAVAWSIELFVSELCALLNHPCRPPFLCRLQPPSRRVQPRYVVSVEGFCSCLCNTQVAFVAKLSKITLCSQS